MSANGASREELEQLAAELARKQATLGLLRQSLEDWERDVHWEELSEAQQIALMKLAHESVTTLRSMIDRIEADVAAAPDSPPGEGQGH